MLTYEQARAYLHSLQRLGVKLGLDRTVELLRRVGRPDRRSGRIIHVTGTSGKGSVSAMIESGLRAAGYRVGLYTSPALESFTERYQVNRVNMAEADLAALVSEIQPHLEAMVAEGHEQPTEFEVTTVLAFMYFARQNLDWLVLEVGVGGRYDATNAIDNAAVTCITNIGLDHTDWLGATHEKIAWEKAGIIKPAVPCVTGTDHAGALEVIRQEALSNDSVLVEVGAEDAVVVSHGLRGQVAHLLGARGWYRDVELSLLGRHQAANAAVALRVLELCGLTEDQIRAGFATVNWPGRFEVRPGQPTVVLDAAHNPAKCQALAEAMADYFPGRRVHLVVGALADKNVHEMVAPLLRLATRVWAVTPESPRALQAVDLAKLCLELGSQATVAGSIGEGMAAALAASGPEDLVLITGSFYTVGPARLQLDCITESA